MPAPDPLPPPGSPEWLGIPVAGTPKENAAPLPAGEQTSPLPQHGSPTGAAVHSVSISPETQRALDAQAEQERNAAKNAARGQIMGVIPELRLPRFLLGIVAILSLAGLFVFAQTISILAQITVLSPVPRWSSYVLLVALLAGVVFGAARLLIAYFRLRRTQKITLRGIDDLNQRAQFRKLAAEETKQAAQLVREYLDDFPEKVSDLVRIKFSPEQAEKLLAARKDLLNPAKILGNARWLRRFRQDFQSVLDEAADACIKRHAKGVGLKVAALPLALVETAVVLYSAFTMIGDLCEIYNLRLGAPSTLIVTGWAAIQGVLAGQVEGWTKDEHKSWLHDSGQDVPTADKIAPPADDAGAETVRQVGSAATHSFGDLHVPFAGRIFKRAAKGFVQYMLLRRLGRLTQGWLRMVE